MSGVPKLIVARPNYDIRTASAKNLAFSSDYNLSKIVRSKKSTTETAFAHGLPYTPRVVAMREVTSGKFAWGGLFTVDGTNISPRIHSHHKTYGVGTTKLEDDTAVWIYIFIDPLVAGDYKKNMVGKPVLKVGSNVNDSDYKQKIHSRYDTFKVAKTGTLTINAPEYDPGVSGGVKTTQATVDHNLGYVPMFAPFVPYETEREGYLSWNSQYNSDCWTEGITYYTGQEVENMDTGVWYVCKLTHTASSSNKPETGASWQTYWDIAPEPDFYNTYVNALEDQKFIYGGVEAFNLSYIKLYSTSTQLVLELTQDCYPDSPPGYEYTPCPAEKVTVDYTVFYNRANLEFNLL